MLTPEQRRLTLAGIDSALEAIRDNSPVTEEECRHHERLVLRELERKAKQQSLGLD